MIDFIDWIWNSPAIRAGLFFCLGVCIGSFLTALLYRIPRKLNWTTDRSRCTSCNHTLGVVDLVPIFSWMALRGRCRHCGTRVSMRYPLIELSFGLSALALSFFI